MSQGGNFATTLKLSFFTIFYICNVCVALYELYVFTYGLYMENHIFCHICIMKGYNLIYVPYITYVLPYINYNCKKT